jgi:hypothetical protein
MIDIIIAEAVLGLHLIIIAFNVAGLILIPVGAWLGWRIVRVAWLRLLYQPPNFLTLRGFPRRGEL